MAKKIIKKYMPDPDKIKAQKSLRFLGDRLHDPNLWHLNRRSVSLAFAVGLFVAWVPTPMQMAFAATGAFYARANLPISVALVWITNPITMPPLFYFAYRVGVWALNKPYVSGEFSVDTVFSSMADIGGPFLFGCFLVGTTCATLGYFGMQLFWRWHVSHDWDVRQSARSRDKSAG
ncbi:MAG: DUF2062 domain-containing protein [Methylomonas sp.]|nr:DUF2062 domain-containing protein [Methylomonas sp.]PPD21068.1 MAG: ATP-binding protein [Methylomonas sp.]PPD25302.1 MAG: ATP-binding protein [Methylomonas sp.]PPD35280.1 MAG: ATP-binding protein [Methylomonas sp.]PPD38495.1 MAG: ATP-binding protein [Methylomonas sp.]